ncbi:MAG: sugar phosphate nucleotidyltransferase [Thermoplasmata archaeon]
MQVVILAGGRGERLRPFTDNIPKPLISIKGKPFLYYQISYLNKYNLKEIVLCVGYLSEKIIEYFNEHPIPDVKIEFSIEKTPLGTGGALKNAEPMINDEFILINGDTYSLLNFSELIEYYYKNYYPVVMTAYDNHEKIADNNVLVGPNNIVLAYNKEFSYGMTHVDSGVLVIRKEDFFKNMPDKEKFSFEHEVYPRLIEQRKILAYPTTVRFYDIGTPERLKKIEEVI